MRRGTLRRFAIAYAASSYKRRSPHAARLSNPSIDTGRPCCSFMPWPTGTAHDETHRMETGSAARNARIATHWTGRTRLDTINQGNTHMETKLTIEQEVDAVLGADRDQRTDVRQPKHWHWKRRRSLLRNHAGRVVFGMGDRRTIGADRHRRFRTDGR